MFGVLVNHHVGDAAPSRVRAQDEGTTPRARRLTRMLGLAVWLPFIALTLKKAV